MKHAFTNPVQDAWKVRPIPLEVLHLNGQWEYKWPVCPQFKKLKTGEWTLLVVTEEKRNSGEYKTLRYAFVTRDRTGQLLTADIDDFVGRPAQLAAPSQANRKKTAYSRLFTTTAVPGEEALATIDWNKVTVCGMQEVADVMGPFMAKYIDTWLMYFNEK